MKQYEEIIHHQRPVSRKHKPMSIRDRAAQFASFAALSGYEDMVEEKRKILKQKLKKRIIRY